MNKAPRRYIKRIGPKGVTVWTWTPELANRSDCLEISEREALHIKDPANNPAPPNITNLQHLDDNLVTMLGALSEDQQKQLLVLMGQVQHGQISTQQETQPEIPATALDMSAAKVHDDTVGHTKESYEDNEEIDDTPVSKNGRPSHSALNRMTKTQLQEHSTTYFPDKPEFDIEDPNNTNDFMREKINEWWDEREKA